MKISLEACAIGYLGAMVLFHLPRVIRENPSEIGKFLVFQIGGLTITLLVIAGINILLGN
jgi:hypothetical protein